MGIKITRFQDTVRHGSALWNAATALLIAIIMLLLMVQSGLVQSAMAQSGGIMDPLSEDEINTTLSAALRAGAAKGADSEISAAALQQEILLVERHQSKKGEIQSASAARQGDAYIYDYTTDTLKHAIVNLDTGETLAIEEMQNVQLPLTENEVERALDLAFQNESLRTELQSSYQLVSGNELTNIDQLNVKAFIFLAESMPDSVNGLSESCGLHRCAQLLLYTEDDTILEVQPIVDLSRQIVTQDITNKTALITDETLIANENIEETTADLSAQPDGAAQVALAEQTLSIFLPYVGRNQFKDQEQGAVLTFDQQLRSWWCYLFGNTFIDDLFGSACDSR